MSIKFLSIFFLIIYIYLDSILALLNVYIDTSNIYLIKQTFLIIVPILILFLNKLKITKKFFLFYLIFFILILINILFSNYKSLIMKEAISISLNLILPSYILLNIKINWKLFIIYLYKSAIVFTLLFPIFIFFRLTNEINYFEIGYLIHLNILFLSLKYLITKSNKESYICQILILIYCVFEMILGSRMLTLANLIILVYIVLIKNKGFNFKSIFRYSIIFIFVSFLTINFVKILKELQEVMSQYDIYSRNLTLFIMQIEGNNDSLVSSGRDNIYQPLIELLFENFGLPRGLLAANISMDGRYYHAHNFILEVFLTFGILFGLFFIFYILYKIWEVYKLQLDSRIEYKYFICIIFVISFAIRSLTGTYFFMDKIFIILFFLLFIHSNKK